MLTCYCGCSSFNVVNREEGKFSPILQCENCGQLHEWDEIEEDEI